MLMQKVFGTGGIHFAAGDDCSILLSFLWRRRKDKILSFNDYSTDRRKLLLGKIIYIGYMILFSNVIVFAGATLEAFF